MSANNNETNIEAIATAVAYVPVAEAELLQANYEGDEGAEFLCELMNTMNYFESYLENPEDLCLPDENGEIPYVAFIEMMSELRNTKWAKRTLTRMENFVAGKVPAARLTELQKSEDPEYVECLNCSSYYKGKAELEKHQARKICQERNTRMFLKGTTKKLPSGKILRICLVLDDLIKKSIAYKKSIEPELEEEKVAEEEYEVECMRGCGNSVITNSANKDGFGYTCNDCLKKEEEEYEVKGIWKVRVYWGKDNVDYYDEGGADFHSYWDNLEEASLAYESAIGTGSFYKVELVDITDGKDIIDCEWETEDGCYECGRPLGTIHYTNGEDDVCSDCVCESEDEVEVGDYLNGKTWDGANWVKLDDDSDSDDEDPDPQHRKLVKHIIKLAHRWEGEILNLASNKYSGCGLAALPTEKLFLLIKVMNQQISDKQEEKIIMSCIDCSITKEMALETIKIKYPHLYEDVENNWDKYHKKYLETKKA
jgi:hypothetical protein